MNLHLVIKFFTFIFVVNALSFPDIKLNISEIQNTTLQILETITGKNISTNNILTNNSFIENIFNNSSTNNSMQIPTEVSSGNISSQIFTVIPNTISTESSFVQNTTLENSVTTTFIENNTTILSSIFSLKNQNVTNSTYFENITTLLYNIQNELKNFDGNNTIKKSENISSIKYDNINESYNNITVTFTDTLSNKTDENTMENKGNINKSPTFSYLYENSIVFKIFTILNGILLLTCTVLGIFLLIINFK